LLGPSGSGKSSVVRLLQRLYDVSGGRILFDGVDITELDRSELRRQFGVVLQEPFLFTKTLRENIRIGRSAASDTEVMDAAATACIHESIQRFEKTYDTMLGERGVTLSGGQRQRVAIARALLLESPVLMLDDALSAVDTETETAILDALKRRHEPDDDSDCAPAFDAAACGSDPGAGARADCAVRDACDVGG